MAKASRFAPEIIEKYINGKWWDKRALCDFWDKNAIDYPDEECLVCSDTRLTWLQAKQWIDRLALGLLELGIEKDDMLVIQFPNTAELFTLRVACEKTSILCLPVMTAFRHKEMEYILKQVEAVGLVIPWVFRDLNRSCRNFDISLSVGTKYPKGLFPLKRS
jgi:non-ribosomal peptide synthetase component E (peptide arylation enzyme)